MSSIWLLLFLVRTSAFTSESNNYDACPESWRKSFLVTDNQCPRFVYVQTGIEHGLGDQLERLFLAMSIIHGRWSQTRSIPYSLCKHSYIISTLFAGYPSLNITLVVDDTFGTRSLNHYPEGYGTIFHELLNFPRHILRYSLVNNQHSFSYSLTLNHIRTYSQTLSNSIQHPLNSPFCHRYKGCHGVTLYIHYNCSLNSLCVYLMFRYANGTT